MESSPCGFQVVDWSVGQSANEASSAVIEITGSDEDVAKAVERVKALITALSSVANTTMRLLPHSSTSQKTIHTTNASVNLQESSPIQLSGPKKVLILGAGMVSGPLLRYLHQFPEITLAVGAADIEEAKRQCHGLDRAHITRVDITKEQSRLEAMINEADLVISLLPAPMHPDVMKICIAKVIYFVSIFTFILLKLCFIDKRCILFFYILSIFFPSFFFLAQRYDHC